MATSGLGHRLGQVVSTTSTCNLPAHPQSGLMHWAYASMNTGTGRRLDRVMVRDWQCGHVILTGYLQKWHTTLATLLRPIHHGAPDVHGDSIATPQLLGWY